MQSKNTISYLNYVAIMIVLITVMDIADYSHLRSFVTIMFVVILGIFMSNYEYRIDKRQGKDKEHGY